MDILHFSFMHYSVNPKLLEKKHRNIPVIMGDSHNVFGQWILWYHEFRILVRQEKSSHSCFSVSFFLVFLAYLCLCTSGSYASLSVHPSVTGPKLWRLENNLYLQKKLQVCKSFLTICLPATCKSMRNGRWAHFNIKLHFLFYCDMALMCALDFYRYHYLTHIAILHDRVSDVNARNTSRCTLLKWDHLWNNICQ